MADKTYEQRVQEIMKRHDFPRDLAEKMLENVMRQETLRARIQAQPTARDTNALLGSMNPMYN